MTYSTDDNIICGLAGAVLEYSKSSSIGPIDLALRPGDILGLKGENGSGKSTVVAMLAGISKLSSGRRTVKRGCAVGYVPQDITLYPTLTARQNLAFFAGVYGLFGRRRKARIRWLLELVKLDAHANKRVGSFSGGMKRRLNLACALTVTPDLLLLDEPTVGADEDSKRIILDVARHIADMGGAVVLVSHMEGELDGVCTRLMTLSGGRVILEEARI